MKKVMAIVIVLVMLVGLVPAIAVALDEPPGPGPMWTDSRLRNASWEQFTPELLLEVAMDTPGWRSFAAKGWGNGMGAVFSVGEIYHDWPHEPHFQVVVEGDCIEIVSARLVYSEGTVVEGIWQTFTDGERVTLVMDERVQNDVENVNYRALVVKWRAVSGTTDSGLRCGVNGNSGLGASISAAEARGLAVAPSRTGGTGSVQDILEYVYNSRGELSAIKFKPDPNLPGSTPTTPPPTPTPPANTTAPNYLDVATSHWAYANIVEANRRGLMTGVEVRPNGDIRFDPEGTLTRAQVAQIVYNAYRERFVPDYTNPYVTKIEPTDVPAGAWYYDAVCWLATNWFWNETERQTFKPNDPATRAFVAEVLYRLSGSMVWQLPKTVPAVNFPDVSGEYAEAINALQQAGVIAGFPDGTFKPDNTLTRAQAAALIVRYTDIPGLEP